VNDIAADIARAAALLEGAERIVVSGHVRPDGDALGSMVALAGAARQAGKSAFATFGEPFVVPRAYSFLDQSTLVPPDSDFGPIDVLVACDTAAPDRLGSVAALAEAARSVLVVDHHISNDGFGDVAIIDPAAAATAQLVYRLILALEWKLTPSVATALYAGLVTDTGRFQYSSTTAEVHHMAAALIDAGVRPDEVGQRLYAETPFGYLRVAGAVLERAVLDRDTALVWSVLYEEDLAAAGIDHEDAEALIDLIRIAEEAEVACLLKEVEEGVTKGSLRSRGRVDVAAVAAALGGGGHHNAAGFTYEADPERVIELVRRRL